MQLTLSAGFPPTMTVGDPGTHGAGHDGIHGAGASAATTAGFIGLLHIPKVIGGFGISIIVPTRKFCAVTVICEVTVNGAGATPNVH